jgi:hypothetical protein
MGSIGGFGYAMYCKAYVIAAAVLIVSAMAFPTIRKVFKEWTELQGLGGDGKPHPIFCAIEKEK